MGKPPESIEPDRWLNHRETRRREFLKLSALGADISRR